MTLPKEELQRRNRKFKRRQKKYKSDGWPIGGPHSAHPGIGFGESVEADDTGLLDVADWDDVPRAVKSAMAYEMMVETALRRLVRCVLSEAHATGFPRELHIYDFDGTLFDTPGPETGIPLWESFHGTTWPHRGWWGEPESLDLDVFDIGPNPHVLAQFEQSMGDPGVHTVVLTGRHTGLRPQVSTVLNEWNVQPDELVLTPSLHGTLSFKMGYIEKWVERVPLERVVMWEDRESHVQAFTAMSDDLGIPVIVYSV